jgi:hypothetical protein
MDCIWTGFAIVYNIFDSKGEVLLTILSSLAQDEFTNISENCTWGIRRKFEQDKVFVNHVKLLGYDKDAEGNLIINEKQAKTVDFLTKRRVENNGEIPQYYVEEGHPAIIDKDMWEAVQLEMERRRNFAKKYNFPKFNYATIDNPFAGRVICGHYGSTFGRKV